jgi:hypothetical protein
MKAASRAIGFVLMALLAVAAPASVYAQSALLQGGPITAGHVPVYINSYSQQPVVTDSGPAAGGPPGTGLSELGITARGNGTAPYANAGTGNMATNFCDYDAPTTNATGYHSLCFSPNAQGGGLIAYNAFGTASALPFTIEVNGQNFTFPGFVNCIGCGTIASQNANNVNITGGTIANTTGSTILATATNGTTARTLAAHFADVVNVLDFGADPTGTNDSTANIQAAINTFPVTDGLVQGGGTVYFPPGVYKVSGSLVLSGRSGVMLVGASRSATKIQSTANAPIVYDSAAFPINDNHVGVENMWLACPGQSNPSADGISFTYVNSGVIRDVFITGCNEGLAMYDEYQTVIDNVYVNGTGSDQNAIGLFAGPPTQSGNLQPNNALIVSNTTIDSVSQIGFDLQYFAGSKFVNDEAAGGLDAWSLCNVAYANIPGQSCQFGNFTNDLGDSTSGDSWYINQGANSAPLNNLVFANIWAGNSFSTGFYLGGANTVNVGVLHVVSADNGLELVNDANIVVDAQISAYNRSNNGSYAVVLSGTTNSEVHANTTTTEPVLGYNGIEEINNSSGNSIWGGVASCTLGLAFGGASTGIAYGGARSCQYEIKGSEVTVQFYEPLTAVGSATGSATLTGLPIQVGPAVGWGYGGVSTLLGTAMTGLAGPILAQAAPASTTVNLYNQGATGFAALTNSNFTSTTLVDGRLNYFKQ